jgi:HEAT repeat protein
MKSKDAASVVVEGSSEEVATLLSTLRADPSRARRVLADLSNDSRAEVRGWVPFAARKLLGREAVSYLVKLAQDRDPDVSNVALQDLLDVEPEAAKTLIKAIRKRLLANDPHESIFAMWTLVQLGDRDSIDAIRHLSERSEFPFQRRTAHVVLLALEGEVDEILRRIREHDHENMQALAYAALLVGGHDGFEAVKQCAENAPDPECRHYCEWNLRQQRN